MAAWTRAQNPQFRRAALLASAVLIVLAAGAAAVAGTSDTSAGPTLPPDKEARLQEGIPSIDPSAYASEKAAYLGSSPSPAPSEDASPGPDDQYVPIGIIDSGEGPFSPDKFTMQNQWQGVISDTLYDVYAGAYTSDPSQGVALVARLDGWPSPSPGTSSSDLYPAPSGAGSLEIVGVNGTEHLTMDSASGSEFDFDVVTGAFQIVESPSPTPSAVASSG